MIDHNQSINRVIYIQFGFSIENIRLTKPYAVYEKLFHYPTYHSGFLSVYSTQGKWFCYCKQLAQSGLVCSFLYEPLLLPARLTCFYFYFYLHF